MLDIFKNYNGDWCRYRVGGTILAGIVGVIVINPIVIVQPGQRVVTTRLGNVLEGSLGEGPHFKFPILDKLTYFDTRIQKDLVTGSGFSSDNQEVEITVSVNWRVTATEVPTLFRDLKTQENAKERILNPAVNEEVKAALAEYTAETVIRNRPTLKQSIVEGVTQRLEAQGLTIIPNGINIDNIDFSDEFEAEVEKKVVASQRAAAEVNLAQGRKEAAALDADAKIEAARGEAESARLRAEQLKAQGGSLVIQEQAIEAWREGGAVMPTTLIIGNGQGNTIPEIILNSGSN